MKILIPTIGTRGDIQPYIALAIGLIQSGHQVLFASHPAMESLVAGYRVPFEPIGPDINIGNEAESIRLRSRNWLIGFLRVMQLSVSIAEKASRDVLRLCREVDLTIVSHSFTGKAEAEKAGLPAFSVTLQHQNIPVNHTNTKIIRRPVDSFLGSVMGNMVVNSYNKIRKKIGVPPVKRYDELLSELLNLIPVSPQVITPDPRWAPQHRISGYWFLGEPPGWKPPPEVESFLESGNPPAVISLGAMSLGLTDGYESAKLMVDAVQEAGMRAIIQGWDHAIQSIPLPATIHHAGSIPHSWLLSHAACLVHHGGYGTTGAGLRAGIPEIVIPHITDQYFWGKRVHELGVAPLPIPRKELTALKLAEMLHFVSNDQEMITNSAKIGRQIRSEDGVKSAVKLVNEAIYS